VIPTTVAFRAVYIRLMRMYRRRPGSSRRATYSAAVNPIPNTTSYPVRMVTSRGM
jgi:hypothetical protein